MSRARWVVRTFPFTLLGLASFVVLQLALHGVVSAFGPWRLALLPAYLSALPPLAVAVQLFPLGPVPVWFLVLSGAFRLGLFLAADHLLAWLRRRRAVAPGPRHAPAV